MMDSAYSTFDATMKSSFKGNISKIEVRVSEVINYEGGRLFVPYNMRINEITDYIIDNSLIQFDTPQNQSEIINNLFGEGLSATVKGNMTNTQWVGVANKVTNALNAAYTAVNAPAKTIFRNVFGGNDCQIIIEITPIGYTRWKTTTDGKTLYLAFNALDENLIGTILDAFESMYNGRAETNDFRIYTTIADGEVEVWQTEGVTNAQMDSFVNMMNEGYSSELDNMMKSLFKANVDKIEVRAFGAISHQGNNLFTPYNATMTDFFIYLANNGFLS
jgi:hypothetical protein